MIHYTVHKPPVFSQDQLDQADELVFVREGFSWLAFLFPVLWLPFNRLWVETGIFVFFAGLLSAAATEFGINETVFSLCMIVVSLFFGFEGNNLKRWKLARQDYVMIGSTSGRNRVECELKFFTYWLSDNRNSTQSEILIPGTPAGTASLAGFTVPRVNPKTI